MQLKKKRKLEKCFLGASVWAPKLVYWSSNRPEYVTASVFEVGYISFQSLGQSFLINNYFFMQNNFLYFVFYYYFFCTVSYCFLFHYLVILLSYYCVVLWFLANYLSYATIIEILT